jgi:hypothetical protein
MRKTKKLQIPFARGFVQRQIVTGQEALSRFESGQGETPVFTGCNDNPCEHGILICDDACEDNFDRSTSVPSGTWGTGPCGPWLGVVELLEINVGDRDEPSYVDGDEGVTYFSPDPSSDPTQGLRFSGGLTLPFEIEFDFRTTTLSGSTIATNDLIFYVAPFHHQDYDTWITTELIEGDVSLAWFAGDEEPLLPLTAWPLVEDIEFTTVGTITGPARQKIQVDTTGVRVKMWMLTDPEPDEWHSTAHWTSPPLQEWFRVIFFEPQQFNSPVSTTPQPRFRVDRFQLTEGSITSNCYIQYQDGSVYELNDAESVTASVIASLRASSSSAYMLPTLATSVSEVYVDFIPTDKWYYVPESNSIQFPAPLLDGTQVYARYLFEA